MTISLSKTLRAPFDRLVQHAGSRCCLRKISSLAVAQSQPLEKRMDALADWLDTLYSREAFNGSVLIAKHGRICFERHCGFADVDGRIALSSHSAFSLASVSKQFTAMGIMLLVQKGKLALDDKLAQHMPELAGYGEVTIKQLLHHTSGMPDHMALADEHWNAETVITMRDLLALFETYRPPLDSAPGGRFEYSNTGYVFLGEIISRTSGLPYAEFMTSEIFTPLGMSDSAAFNLASQECTLRSRVFGLRKQFVCFGKKVPCDLNYLDGVFGDGGIYASGEDLVRWDAALRDGTLIACDVYQQAYESGRTNDGETTGYGYGWELGPPHVVEHWGEWQGFTSYMRRDLKKHTLLVVLSNLAPSICVDAISSQLSAFVEGV